MLKHNFVNMFRIFLKALVQKLDRNYIKSLHYRNNKITIFPTRKMLFNSPIIIDNESNNSR